MLDDIEYGCEYGPAAGWLHAVQGQVAGGQGFSVTFTYLEVV